MNFLKLGKGLASHRQTFAALAAACLLVGWITTAAQAAAVSGQEPIRLNQIRLNQIQVVGTHNSYNMGFAPSEERYFSAHFPDAFQGVDYHHQPLAQQLDAGVRQLELDIVADPKGGRFAHPKIVALTQQAGLPPDPGFDPHHAMDRPGFKVIHLGDLNLRSSCLTFVQCLRDVRGWSKAHPQHVPVFILVEDKQGSLSQLPDATTAEPWTKDTWDAMDAEIRSVFKPDEIITPDQVRAGAPTLESAVLAGHWPALAQSRGKVVFLLYNRKSAAAYREGHPLLQGRVLFTNGVPGEPDAAFVERDRGDREAIAALVKAGYIVRTRADYNTQQGRTGDTARREETLASGAQMISTDFPVSEPAPRTGYAVGLPNGMAARCNPVNAPATCRDADLESGLKRKNYGPAHKP